jgi:murein DD-endopeptidase MepM/ murein hydrolase activator NlpD
VNGGNQNEDYFIFGRPILCPLDGVVVEAVDGLRDNRLRQVNERMVSGNFVLIRHSDSVFMHLSHLKCGSVLVRAGAVVRRGEVLAACGNSGRSTEPHLHFHVQSDDRLGNPKGLKCWFERVRVAREVKHDYSPVRSDIVENANKDHSSECGRTMPQSNSSALGRPHR